jgi:phosphate transporter
MVDSGAMGLPVTSFPNAQCYSLKDKRGTPYLTAMDYVKTGFPVGILEVILMMTVAYWLLYLVTS